MIVEQINQLMEDIFTIEVCIDYLKHEVVEQLKSLGIAEKNNIENYHDIEKYAHSIVYGNVEDLPDKLYIDCTPELKLLPNVGIYHDEPINGTGIYWELICLDIDKGVYISPNSRRFWIITKKNKEITDKLLRIRDLMNTIEVLKAEVNSKLQSKN